jgi:transcriptional regulator with GAF, ATPase, and Fis domain
MTESDELAAQLAEMARSLLRKRTVQETLDGIVELAVAFVDGCDYAGIFSVERGGSVDTAAASHAIARASDTLQKELREGPCFDALRYDETFEITDMSQDSRWPRYTARAARLGIGSVLGFQLSVGAEGTLGALNLHASRPYAFGDRSRRVGRVFAAQAAVALAWARTEAQLWEANRTRQLIGEAMGVLMERHKITQDEAFDFLRRASQQQSRKLRDVAEWVVVTGERPFTRSTTRRRRRRS